MPSPSLETSHKGNFYILVIALIVVCLGITLGVFFTIRNEKPQTMISKTTLEPIRAEVHFEGTVVLLKNQNSFSWDNDMLVYVGDAPPVGYSHNMGIVSPGDTASITLNEFARSTGEKFIPYGMSVNEVWMGDKNHPFQNFTETGAANFYGATSVVK